VCCNYQGFARFGDDMYSSDDSGEPNCFAELDGSTSINDSGSECNTSAYETNQNENVSLVEYLLCRHINVALLEDLIHIARSALPHVRRAHNRTDISLFLRTNSLDLLWHTRDKKCIDLQYRIYP
jgi:hypothetical protein